MSKTRVLVTGGRHYDNAFEVNRALSSVLAVYGEFTLIHGGAEGADALADRWAARHDIERVCFRAEWQKHGRRAGPLRNQRMLEEGKPNLVIAFPGFHGTADMVRRARQAGVAVEEWDSLEGR